MAISVYKVQSPLSQVTDARVTEYLQALEAELGEPLSMVTIDAWVASPFGLIFVASGGSEGLFLEQYPKIADKPLYILTSGESNSLAASMEILSYLQQQGKQGEILHGSVQSVAARIRALRSVACARARMNNMRLGLIGESSDWLIASPADGSCYREKLGISLVKLPMKDLLDEIRKGGYEDNTLTRQLKAMGYDAEEMEKSLSVYGALKRLVSRYGLSGITVRCFDLLDTVHTTGCLALAILNAEGIYAGCEGDVPALVSMVILGEVSGQPVFQCNPSRIDTANGEMVLAHCTLPLNMPYRMTLTTHYESGIGVAIAGSIPEKACTIFKTSASLDRHFTQEGVIIENLHEPTLCRTQIKMRLDDYSYFLTKPIQNHHLVCLGEHKSALDELFAQING